jgi:hypothetical protein
MLSTLASTPWLQFNPLSLMNANKGVFGANLRHMWDEIYELALATVAKAGSQSR